MTMSKFEAMSTVTNLYCLAIGMPHDTVDKIQIKLLCFKTAVQCYTDYTRNGREGNPKMSL